MTAGHTVFTPSCRRWDRPRALAGAATLFEFRPLALQRGGVTLDLRVPSLEIGALQVAALDPELGRLFVTAGSFVMPCGRVYVPLRPGEVLVHSINLPVRRSSTSVDF